MELEVISWVCHPYFWMTGHRSTRLLRCDHIQLSNDLKPVMNQQCFSAIHNFITPLATRTCNESKFLDLERGVRLKCYYAFFLVCCGCDTSYIVSVHIQCQASIYTLSLCRGHSWRVRLAMQETLTPSGHLVSPLVFRGP